MKRATILAALSAMAMTTIASAPAFATPVLTFSPVSQVVDMGGIATVDVTVSGLEGELVGAYDFFVNWDSSLLSLNGLTFGSALDGPLDSIADFIGSAGTVNAFEISLGALANQDGASDIVLFTLAFNTLSVGTSALTFTGNIASLGGFLGDELGNLLLTDINSGSITIRPSVLVPEPATLPIMALALCLVAIARYRPFKYR